MVCKEGTSLQGCSYSIVESLQRSNAGRNRTLTFSFEQRRSVEVRAVAIPEGNPNRGVFSSLCEERLLGTCSMPRAVGGVRPLLADAYYLRSIPE